MVKSLEVFHLVTALKQPYNLSFGPLHQFDSFIAITQLSNGSWRCCESMPLPGYSHESVELMESEYSRLAHERNLTEFLSRNSCNPFVTSPIETCRDETFPKPRTVNVPLCPILQWQDLSDILVQSHNLAQAGNKVVKVKLCGEQDANAAIIKHTIHAGIKTGLRFRYDANQAMSTSAATSAIRLLDHPSTELLEQPFPVDAWDAMEQLYRDCPIPLMLDEAITDASTIERATSCANIIKLKLTKNRTPSNLRTLILQAKKNGLEVILGNGAQGTIGCLIEGWVQDELKLNHPGEMNGYRKISNDPLGFLIQNSSTGMTINENIDWPKVHDILAQHSKSRFEIINC